MYSPQVIFSKVTTSCTIAIAAILHRKFSKILENGTLQNPYQKIPVTQNSSVRSTENSGFSKIAGCVLEGRTFLKHCYNMNFFKMFF